MRRRRVNLHVAIIAALPTLAAVCNRVASSVCSAAVVECLKYALRVLAADGGARVESQCRFRLSHLELLELHAD